jgi:hypothetical protein
MLKALLAISLLWLAQAEPLYSQQAFTLTTCTADTGTGGCQLLGSSMLCYKISASTFNDTSGREVLVAQNTVNACWPSELESETNSKKQTQNNVTTTLTTVRYVTDVATRAKPYNMTNCSSNAECTALS